MSDPGHRELPPPTGYRVFRGAALIAEYQCPMCDRRAFCLCASAAWERAKREARIRGGQLSIRTCPSAEHPDGILLSSAKSADASSGNVRRSGPSKPPIAEPQTTESEEDEEDSL